MARRAARVDDNQPEIVEALRKCGASVAITSMVGAGYPDIVVGYQGVNYLVEIKDGKKVPSAQKLTPAQVEFRDKWRGQYVVVNSVAAALAVIGVKIT